MHDVGDEFEIVGIGRGKLIVRGGMWYLNSSIMEHEAQSLASRYEISCRPIGIMSSIEKVSHKLCPGDGGIYRSWR